VDATPTEREEGEADRLLADPEYLRSRLGADVQGVAAALEERYPEIDPGYVRTYLEHIRDVHRDNPQAGLYIASELGAPRRQAELLGWLRAAGLDLAGKSCLDVGCNNGALALACLDAGARRVVGIDVVEDKLVSARRLCGRRPVEFRNVDVLEEDLGETFDVVLCTDVLEHVPDPARMLRRIFEHLSPSRNAFACVAVFNKLLPRNVVSEPHYDVPGLILMPHEEAAALWREVRSAYHSNLDYGVYHWHTYEEYVAMARAAGIPLRPYQGPALVRSALPEMRAWEATFGRLEEDLERKLATSPLSASRRARVQELAAAYLARARADHAERLREEPSQLDLDALYFRYYAQPLLLILERPRRPRWWRRLLGRT
jgi:2-polyprenyl-3-methyl-5-hydroxy-6-metoxy-1,4-benzoquinol methylase